MVNRTASFGQLLAGYRALAGIRSQSELARQLAVSQSQVNRWEQDHLLPGAAELVVLELMLDTEGALRAAWESAGGKLPGGPRRVLTEKALAAAREAELTAHIAAAVEALETLRGQVAKQAGDDDLNLRG